MTLDEAIDIILRRIYIDQEIDTFISKREIKVLLHFCTKNVHFSFHDEIYVQNSGVALGSSLGLVLANIFMVELENTIITSLENKIKNVGKIRRRHNSFCKGGFNESHIYSIK